MATYLAPTSDFQTSTLSGAIAAADDTATIGTGLDLPATNGILQIDYDSTTALGADNGPETIAYATYTTGTGALAGMTRGLNGTTGVAHANGAKVQCGVSASWFGNAMITPASLYNPYKFRAYRNAAANSPNAVAAKITLDAENYDPNSNFATGTYTAPVTGYYHISGTFAVASSVVVAAYIYVDGASVAASQTATAFGATVASTLYLTVGQTVEFWCYTGSAQAYTATSAATYMSGHLLSV